MVFSTALLGFGLLLLPADTNPTTSAVGPDTLRPSFAPSLDNRSLLGATIAGLPLIPIEGITPATTGGVTPDSTRRPRAIQYSDLYYTRLKIHQVASYLTVPLFLAQYLAGRELWNHPDSHGLARDVHGPLAAGVAGLFAVNTVTGVWNLWEGRRDPKGRTRRWVHGLTMLVADAGFVVVGATAPDDDFRANGGSGRAAGASTHRDVAIGSMGLALGSYVMMLLWKD